MLLYYPAYKVCWGLRAILLPSPFSPHSVTEADVICALVGSVNPLIGIISVFNTLKATVTPILVNNLKIKQLIGLTSFLTNCVISIQGDTKMLKVIELWQHIKQPAMPINLLGELSLYFL